MALSIGTIKQISGIVIARNAAGQERILKVGDSISFEDTISTVGGGSHALLALADGREIFLGGNDVVILDKSVYASDEGFGHEAVVASKTVDAMNSGKSVTDIQEALLRGEDISNLEATAAGETGAGAGGGNVISGFATAQYATGGNESNITAGTRTLADNQDATTTFTPINANNAIEVNNLPMASDTSISLNEDESIVGTLPLATDVDGDVIVYSLDSSATNGVVVVNADGTYTYTPTENYNGTDSFTYTVTDSNGGSSTYTVSIDVSPMNDAPTASDTTINLNEDAIYTGTLPTANDVDNDSVTYALDTATTNGTIVINSDGSYIYTPNANYNGADNFTYTVTDGNGGSNTYSVSIGINPVNDQPVVTNIDANANTGVSGDVEYSNTTSTYIADVTTTTSTITITDSGTVEDLNVQINLTHTWDSDLDIYLVAPDGTVIELTSDNGGSGDNYTNTIFDDDAATSIISGGAPFTGTFRPEGDLSLLEGMDISGTWTLRIVDDLGADVGTLISWSIATTIDGTNTVYESSDTLGTTSDVVTTFDGTLATATDNDAGDTHTYAQYGDVSLDSTDVDTTLITGVGVVIDPVTGQYTLSGNFNALGAGESVTITFQYTANDGHGFTGMDGVNASSTSEPATVTLVITGTNDKPVVQSVSISTTEADSGNNTVSGMLSEITDADVNDTHTYEINQSSISSSNNAVTGLTVTLVNAATGEFRVDGDFNALGAGETATITFQYRVNDGSASSSHNESHYSDYQTVTLTCE
ncbi:MAG: hypothetical protein H6Q35_2636 [Proteobacteria bacterium]|nr:hypothetical protein [Pseudomonadota bacterium]